MKKKRYNVRWGQAGQPSIANVDIMATSDINAKRSANKTARELGVTNTPRTIYEGGRCVEVNTKGVSND